MLAWVGVLRAPNWAKEVRWILSLCCVSFCKSLPLSGPHFSSSISEGVGQVGDPFSFHYFLRLRIVKNFCLSSESHLREVKLYGS